MSFALYVSVDDVTTQLNDGAPFRLESAAGLSSAGVTRLGQRGPLQSGVTDLGYRLRPRDITLNLIFSAADDSTLDSYRDQLIAAFKPLTDVSIFLSVQRDDDEIRTLTCHTTDEIAIALAPELRPGHTHRATVQLRAAYPLYKANGVTAGSATFDDLGDWQLAGGSIAAGNVRYTTEMPSGNALYTFGGGQLSNDWSAAFVTAKDTAVSATHYVFDADLGNATFFVSSGSFSWHVGAIATTWPGTAGYNYHVIESRSGTQYWRYWNGSSLVQHKAHAQDFYLDNVGYWRGNGVGSGFAWEPDIRKGVFYATVTLDQLNTLGPYILDTPPGNITLVNDGDVYAYPVLSLQGPINDPVITNTTTGQVIDLTGGTIGDGVTWTVDLRDGNKRIYDQSGNNVMGSVSASLISMADFALAPHPIAAGGTNALVMIPGSIGSAAVFTAQITNEYMSF